MSSKRLAVLMPAAAVAAACLVTAAVRQPFLAPRLAGPARGTRPEWIAASTPTIRCAATTTPATSRRSPMFDLSKSYEFVHETFGESVKSWGPALNVNTLGEVPDSSWFTNRIGVRDMTIDEIVRGPNQVDGPAPGTWQVTGRPDSGITPKFTIKDAAATRT